jgi:hypothetical protein
MKKITSNPTNCTLCPRQSVYILPINEKAHWKSHHQHTGSITATALQPSDGILAQIKSRPVIQEDVLLQKVCQWHINRNM